MERALQDPDPPTISRQIVREYQAADALNDLEKLISAFEMLEDGPVVTDSLVALCREAPVGGRQIHDANIVATMLAHGERGLLTVNPADFRRYGYRIELVGG